MATLAAFALSACAHKPPASDPAAVAAYEQADDPLEPTNRALFKFDQGLDKVLIHPMTEAYIHAIPAPGRRGIGHAMDNLRSPITFVNDLLEGKVGRAGGTLFRLVLNSTVGIGGLFDPAAPYVPEHTSDFGETLGVWGAGPGFYLYLPVLGPSGLRDGIGEGVDTFGFDPVAWYSYNPHNPSWPQYAELGLVLLDAKSSTMKTTEELKKSSIDYYATLRSAYQQYRANEVAKRRGQTALPPMDEEGDPFAEDKPTAK
jgi:phospholipid-binding lipoprotein MlaA